MLYITLLATHSTNITIFVLDMKKTAENSSFKPEQEVKVKGIDLAMTNMSTDMLLGNMGAFVLPLKYRWIDKDGEPINPDGETWSRHLLRSRSRRKPACPDSRG